MRTALPSIDGSGLCEAEIILPCHHGPFGLIVGADVMQATGTAEREAALILIDRFKPPSRRVTLGADKLYDAAAFCPSSDKMEQLAA